MRFHYFNLAWWQCSMCRDTAAQMASCLTAVWRMLRNASGHVMGLFRVEEGCVPWHGKWRTLIPQELWPVIFFSWTENLRQLFWADSITPFSPYFLPSIDCHINTLPSPSQHLLLQPGSEQELLAWAINYKQPCLRLGRNDCRKPAQWCTANTPSPKYSYSQHKTNIVIFVFIWLDIVIKHIQVK